MLYKTLTQTTARSASKVLVHTLGNGNDNNKCGAKLIKKNLRMERRRGETAQKRYPTEKSLNWRVFEVYICVILTNWLLTLFSNNLHVCSLSEIIIFGAIRFQAPMNALFILPPSTAFANFYPLGVALILKISTMRIEQIFYKKSKSVKRL